MTRPVVPHWCGLIYQPSYTCSLDGSFFIHLCTCSMHAANSTDNIHISSQEISCCRMCIANMSGGFVYMQYCMSPKKSLMDFTMTFSRFLWFQMFWNQWSTSLHLFFCSHFVLFLSPFPPNPKWEVPLVQLWVPVVANLLLHYVAKVHLLNTEMPSFLGSAECLGRSKPTQNMETSPRTTNACRCNVKKVARGSNWFVGIFNTNFALL